jgi:hypothetical protein
VDALERANVRYLVAGGMAVNAHGFARLTKDLDLLIDLDPANGIRARDVFPAQGLQPRIPVSPRDLADPAKRDAWCERRNLLVFPWMDPSDPVRSVGVWIRNPIDFEQAWARSRLGLVGGTVMRFVSLPDLLDMQCLAGWPNDRRDIEVLSALSEDSSSDPAP